MKTFLPFEKEMEAIESKMEALRQQTNMDGTLSSAHEIEKLHNKLMKATVRTYQNLTPWNVVQIARHPERPYTQDYIDALFTDFQPLHGDRLSEEDYAIMGGLARFNGVSCIVIGHQKGRDTHERTLRNFGMSKPSGYRKVVRLLKMAEKFSLPVFTFVDTPGAYPGVEAEEKGQSQAIGSAISELTRCSVPILVTIIGEGGSGGALALSVGDYVQMLQYSVYSVISPEGCASILWKDAQKAEQAAKALHLTADDLLANQLIDHVVPEPIGAAHRYADEVFQSVKVSLLEALDRLMPLPSDDLLERRLTRLMGYGVFKEH